MLEENGGASTLSMPLQWTLHVSSVPCSGMAGLQEQVYLFFLFNSVIGFFKKEYFSIVFIISRRNSKHIIYSIPFTGKTKHKIREEYIQRLS